MTLLSMLDRFENAAGVYERSDDPADRDELHAARRAIMERVEELQAEAELNEMMAHDLAGEAVVATIKKAFPAIAAKWENYDPKCTDCGGTGETYQTERRCACQPPASEREAELVKALETARKVVEQIVFVATEEGGLSAANGDEAWFSEHGKTALDAIEAALNPSLEQE